MKPALPTPLRAGLAPLGAGSPFCDPGLAGASSHTSWRFISTASVLSLISLGVWLTFAIGRINLGQAAFALIGGYATAILSTRWDVLLAMPAVLGLLAAAVARSSGLPILRLRGVYFAMITLSLTEASVSPFSTAASLTRGASGIVNIPLTRSPSIWPDPDPELRRGQHASRVLLSGSPAC